MKDPLVRTVSWKKTDVDFSKFPRIRIGKLDGIAEVFLFASEEIACYDEKYGWRLMVVDED